MASVNEMVMAVRAPDDTIDLFFRGTANDAMHIRTDQNGTVISGPESLGGIIKGAPDGKWNATMTRLDVFVIGTDDQPKQKTFNQPGGWSPWRSLPGGGIWG